MEKNLYLYFSGTGNTYYVMKNLASLYESQEYDLLSIEAKNVNFSQIIKQAKMIFIGYPIHESMMPFIMKDFLLKHKDDFQDKVISTLVTQMFFSGDGGALAYRLLKKRHVKQIHSIHINMPNNITDVSFLRPKNYDNSKHIIQKADQKIKDMVERMKNGRNIRMGCQFYSRFLGFVLQRFYAYYFYPKMRKKLKINHDTCILCKQCVHACPSHSLKIVNQQLIADATCTVCYRCINLCPSKSLSMFSKKAPKVQYLIKPYQ
jgi:NAD-dependent dihydropyrimidine dehydrogenase PreA subunit/flavodoxin